MGGGTRMLREGVAFALDDGFVAALKAGRFEVVAETVGFDEYRVELADGRLLDPDIVICATGYRSGLEPLFGDLDVLDRNGHPRHPMGQPDPDHPGLWFSGFTPSFTGYFHAAGVTADQIAQEVVQSRAARDKKEQRQLDRDLGHLGGPQDYELQDVKLGRSELTPEGLSNAVPSHHPLHQQEHPNDHSYLTPARRHTRVPYNSSAPLAPKAAAQTPTARAQRIAVIPSAGSRPRSPDTGRAVPPRRLPPALTSVDQISTPNGRIAKWPSNFRSDARPLMTQTSSPDYSSSHRTGWLPMSGRAIVRRTLICSRSARAATFERGPLSLVKIAMSPV